MRIAVVILTAGVIFYFSGQHIFGRLGGGCQCGGCCPGCAGDCAFNLGFPFTYYSSGTNLCCGAVSHFSKIGFILDFIIWLLCIRQIFKIKQKRLFWIISACVVLLIITPFLHYHKQKTKHVFEQMKIKKLNIQK